MYLRDPGDLEAEHEGMTVVELPPDQEGTLDVQEIDLTDVEGMEIANLARFLSSDHLYQFSAVEADEAYSIRGELNEAAECATLYAVRIDLRQEEVEVVDTAHMQQEDFEEELALWEPYNGELEPTSPPPCSPDENPRLDTPSGNIMPEPYGPALGDGDYPFYDPVRDPARYVETSGELNALNLWGRGTLRGSDGISYQFELVEDAPPRLHRVESDGSYSEVSVPEEIGDELIRLSEGRLSPVVIPYEEPGG